MDGSVHWEEWTDTGIFDAAGRLVELQAVGRDVTARKEALIALALSEARLGAIMEHAPVSVHLKDRAGRYLMVNPRAAQIPGRPVDQSIGRTPFGILPEAEARLIEARVMEVLESGRVLITEDHFPSLGKHAWTPTIRFPLRDGAGAIDGIGTFDVEIGERKAG